MENINDLIPSLEKLVAELEKAGVVSKEVTNEIRNLLNVEISTENIEKIVDVLKTISAGITNLNQHSKIKIDVDTSKIDELVASLEKLSLKSDFIRKLEEGIDTAEQEIITIGKSSGDVLGKELADSLADSLLSELKRISPNIKERLREIYGDIGSVQVSKLPTGMFKISGKIDGREEIRYVDKLGNLHKSLRTASRLTREELQSLIEQFPQLAKEAEKYGVSLEQIVRYEKLLGRNAVKVDIVTDDGKLTLFADGLGRVATSLRELKKIIPDTNLERISNQFRRLEQVLKNYGATLRDIKNISVDKRGITRIDFSAIDKRTGLEVTRTVYGDRRGRVFEDYRRASTLTSSALRKVRQEFASALELASKYGGTTRNLTSIVRDEEKQITGLVFAVKEGNKALREFTVWTDKAGRTSLVKKDLGESGFTSAQLKDIETRFPKLKKYIDEYKLSMDNLKSAHTELSTGITRLTFVMKGEDGIVRTLNVSLDKYGNVLRDVQRKYQGFLDGVVRNTMEAAKWAVAIQLTYVPLQKLNELMQLAIENQDKLADSAIALNMKISFMGRVFSDIYKVANETATPVGEALEGFSAAFRATAGLGTNARRTAVALDILKNSLILSKLAAIDQKEAIDILISSLRQMNMPLTESATLLNKWIATSKSSQVGISDLAEAYSVVGAAAKSSGFDIDTLNGVIAALAESTSYSGKEVGNIIRSFISNMSTDSARKEMTSLGISIKDVNGELRSSLDILEEISSKYQAGLISDDQLKELARTLAGGSRRAAPMITLIKVYGKALQLANVSARAVNESQTALNIKLETAKSKVTELSNAFQKLAETVGADGGVLDIFGIFADSLKEILSLMDGLVSYGGSTVTIFSTLLPMMAYLNSSGRLTGPAMWLSGKIFGMQKVMTGEGEVMQPKRIITGSQLMGGVISASLISSALVKAFEGNEVQAAYDGAGQAIGLAIGAVLGGAPGALAGQFIGSMIGNSFYKAMMDTGDSIAEVLARRFIEQVDKNKKTEEQKLPKTTKEMQDEILQGTLVNAIGKGISWVAKTPIGGLMESIGFWPKGLAKEWAESPALALVAGAFNDNAISRLFINNKMRNQLKDLLKYATKEGLGLKEAPETILNPVRPIDYRARDVRLQNLKELSNITTQLNNQTKQLFESGKISSAEYARRLEDINKLSARLPYVYMAFGEEGVKAFGDVSQAFEAWSKIMIEGTEDEKERLISLVDAINLVQDQLLSGEGNRNELQQTRQELQNQLQEFIQSTTKSINVRTFKPPQVINLEGWTEGDVRLLEQRTKRIMDAYGQAVTKAGITTKEAYNAWLDSLEEIYVRLSDTTMKGISRATPWAINQAKRELAEEGKLSTSAVSGNDFQVRQVNFSSARAGELRAALQWAEQFIKTNFPEYKFRYRDVGIIYSDNKADIMRHTDALQMMLALNKLVEINQKQLDGIYNLPAGATFWVPWQAWNMQGIGGGGTGNFSVSDTEKVTKEISDLKKAFFERDKNEKQSKRKYSRVYLSTYQKPVREPIDISKLPTEPREEYYRYQHFKYIPEIEFKKESTKTILDDIGFLQKLMIEMFTEPFTWASAGGIVDKIKGKTREKSFTKSNVIGQQQQQSSVQFNLELSNRTILTVDGEVLAQVVSKYLGNELLVTARGASINKSVEVI